MSKTGLRWDEVICSRRQCQWCALGWGLGWTRSGARVALCDLVVVPRLRLSLGRVDDSHMVWAFYRPLRAASCSLACIIGRAALRCVALRCVALGSVEFGGVLWRWATRLRAVGLCRPDTTNSCTTVCRTLAITKRNGDCKDGRRYSLGHR